MISRKVFADLLRDRDQQHTSNRVADKSRYDLQNARSLASGMVEAQGTNQYDPGKHQDYRIQRHICYDASNDFVHYSQQPAARYSFSEGNSTHCKENYSP